MKILYYNLHDGTYMTEWQRVQIYDELAHSGVELDIINPCDYESLEQCNETIIKRLREDKTIDVFLTCLPDEYFCHGVIERISEISIPKVLIQFDNLHAPFNNRKTAKFFDLVWLTSVETEKMFKNWGCNTVFLPYASNPYLYNDSYTKPINKVCFIGTPYGSRTQYINELLAHEVDIDVYFSKKRGTERMDNKHSLYVKGDSMIQTVFKDFTFPVGRAVLAGKLLSLLRKSSVLDEHNPHLSLRESLSFEAMNKAYSNYALSLNVTALRNTYNLKRPIQKLHLRTFEIPMSAGLELVSYSEELAGYFSDNEMVYYNDRDEMIDKVRFYTNENHSTLCRQMKLNARKRALEEHTWTLRFFKVFRKLGFKL